LYSTREDKQSFAATILPKENISIKPVTHHADLRLADFESGKTNQKSLNNIM
jgi:hypothetical protein